MINKREKLQKARYSEWLASLFGACFIAFALGMLFIKYFETFTWPLLIVGILMHGWGMYQIHQHNT